MRKTGLVCFGAFLCLWAVLVVAVPVAALAQEETAGAEAEQAPAGEEAATQEAQEEVTTYTLPPEKYQQAVDYARARYRLYFIGVVYGLVILLVVLYGRLAARFRDWAERASSVRFVQALVYVPLL
ncbi:MAG: hypothetical protein ACE5HB_04280, partial [Terriglobia bacterium]